MSDSRYYSWI